MAQKIQSKKRILREEEKKIDPLSHLTWKVFGYDQPYVFRRNKKVA
jgi:hypothetical protein